jgi:hypothetical protein
MAATNQICQLDTIALARAVAAKEHAGPWSRCTRRRLHPQPSLPRSTTTSCRIPVPGRCTAPCSRSPRHPPAWRARGFLYGEHSRVWTCEPLTRSCTWTRWARSTTPPASQGTPWHRHPHRGFETVT